MADEEISPKKRLEQVADLLRCRELDKAVLLVDDHSELLRVLDNDERGVAHHAALAGSLPLLRRVAQGPAPDSLTEADDSGWCPLRLASAAGRVDAVRFLLDSGSDPEGVTPSAQPTPLICAASKNRPAVVEVLLSRGAKSSSRSADGSTALHRAARQGHIEVVNVLLNDPKLNIDSRTRGGQTALAQAIEDEQPDIAKLLVRHGAELDAADHDGRKPIDMADPKLRQLLVEIAAQH